MLVANGKFFFPHVKLGLGELIQEIKNEKARLPSNSEHEQWGIRACQ